MRSRSRNVGIESRASLRVTPPAGLTLSHVSVGGEPLLVFSWPIEDADLPALEALTPAEREVVRLLAAGCTDEEIATARSTSRRTVNNQCASIYRKLGVSSRRELWSHLRSRR